MSIASALTRLSAAKTAIADAIKSKGVTVSSSAGFEDFAGLIDDIEAGGGSTPTPSASDPFVWYKDFTCTKFETVTKPYYERNFISDHYPVKATLIF